MMTERGIRQKRDDGGVKKTLIAFVRRADEGTLPDSLHLGMLRVPTLE